MVNAVICGKKLNACALWETNLFWPYTWSKENDAFSSSHLTHTKSAEVSSLIQQGAITMFDVHL